MFKIIYLVLFTHLLLTAWPQQSICIAAAKTELIEFEYTTPIGNERDLNTLTVHSMQKLSTVNGHDLYRGFTLTRPRGDIFWEGQTLNSSAFGLGPVYMLRFEKPYSAKFAGAIDVSGGLMLYNKRFPAGGEYYNFMWRIGPRLLYRLNQTTQLQLGYTWLHVSNGLSKKNPGYDSNGISFGIMHNF